MSSGVRERLPDGSLLFYYRIPLALVVPLLNNPRFYSEDYPPLQERICLFLLILETVAFSSFGPGMLFIAGRSW